MGDDGTHGKRNEIHARVQGVGTEPAACRRHHLRAHGGTDGLVHHSDRGVQYTGTVYTTRVMEYGTLPSTGTHSASPTCCWVMP